MNPRNRLDRIRLNQLIHLFWMGLLGRVEIRTFQHLVNLLLPVYVEKEREMSDMSVILYGIEFHLIYISSFFSVSRAVMPNIVSLHLSYILLPIAKGYRFIAMQLSPHILGITANARISPKVYIYSISQYCREYITSSLNLST